MLAFSSNSYRACVHSHRAAAITIGNYGEIKLSKSASVEGYARVQASTDLHFFPTLAKVHTILATMLQKATECNYLYVNLILQMNSRR